MNIRPRLKNLAATLCIVGVMATIVSCGSNRTADQPSESAALNDADTNDSAAGVAASDKGPCETNGRLPIQSTTCKPTAKQVAAAAGITIPHNAEAFTASYEQALDWHIKASFTVTPEQAKGYYNVPGYTATSVGGTAATGQGPQGESRSLTLTEAGLRVQVTFEAYTT